YLDRKLAGVQTEIVYPFYMCGDVLVCHGHYLDAHLSGSLANRLQRRAAWSVAGGHPGDELTPGDYESVIVPLTELRFTVPPLPRGTAAQMAFHAQLESI